MGPLPDLTVSFGFEAENEHDAAKKLPWQWGTAFSPISSSAAGFRIEVACVRHQADKVPDRASVGVAPAKNS
jgi:hypothetical protein